MTTSALTALIHLRPCSDAASWLATQPTIEQAYLNCHRGDWLLWLAAKLSLPRPLLVQAACDCARTALCFVPLDEPRPLQAIEAAEVWAASPTSENLFRVRAASSSADAAYADAAAAAAYAADAAAFAYAFAADAAYADATYADAAAAFAYADARTVQAAQAAAYAHTAQADAARQNHAELVRARLPFTLFQEALK
jgi:hypothetical protein